MVDVNTIQNYKFQLKTIGTQFDSTNILNYSNMLPNICIQILNLGT